VPARVSQRDGGAGLDIEAVQPVSPAVGSVIWLHGLGQDIGVMKGVAAGLELTRSGVRSVYVNAPHRLLGLVRKTQVRAWFVQKVSNLASADPATLRAMRGALTAVVDAESALVGSTRVVLAGFSQGAAMALSVGLRHPARLGGLALYAPFLVREGDGASALSPANAGLPVWIGHGRRDWTVPMSTGIEVRDALAERGYDVSWHRYPGVHEPFAGAARDLRAFIDATLLAPGADG
jgi:phospholipase/carboxylesterase